jgi:hypothetical protein
VKLDVERDPASKADARFSTLAANQIGQLMEILGIASMAASVSEGASTKVAAATEARPLDFAPMAVAGIAMCAATDLCRVMAAAGILRLSISQVPDSERDSLLRAWSDAGMSDPDPNSRLAAPPDLNPDMSPVEVDL